MGLIPSLRATVVLRKSVTYSALGGFDGLGLIAACGSIQGAGRFRVVRAREAGDAIFVSFRRTIALEDQIKGCHTQRHRKGNPGNMSMEGAGHGYVSNGQRAV